MKKILNSALLSNQRILRRSMTLHAQYLQNNWSKQRCQHNDADLQAEALTVS